MKGYLFLLLASWLVVLAGCNPETAEPDQPAPARMGPTKENKKARPDTSHFDAHNIKITTRADVQLWTWTYCRSMAPFDGLSVGVRLIFPRESKIDLSKARITTSLRNLQSNRIVLSTTHRPSFRQVRRDRPGWEADLRGVFRSGKSVRRSPPLLPEGEFLVRVDVELGPGLTLTTDDSYLEIAPHRGRPRSPSTPSRKYAPERHLLPPVQAEEDKDE